MQPFILGGIAYAGYVILIFMLTNVWCLVAVVFMLCAFVAFKIVRKIKQNKIKTVDGKVLIESVLKVPQCIVDTIVEDVSVQMIIPCEEEPKATAENCQNIDPSSSSREEALRYADEIYLRCSAPIHPNTMDLILSEFEDDDVNLSKIEILAISDTFNSRNGEAVIDTPAMKTTPPSLEDALKYMNDLYVKSYAPEHPDVIDSIFGDDSDDDDDNDIDVALEMVF